MQKWILAILSVTFSDEFGTKMLVIDEKDDTAKSLHEEFFILNCDPNLVADEACRRFRIVHCVSSKTKKIRSSKCIHVFFLCFSENKTIF